MVLGTERHNSDKQRATYRTSHLLDGVGMSDEDYTLVQTRYRFIVVHPYLVFYKLKDNTVIIYRILHSRRDYLRKLLTFDE
jgi:toxin ParE1/3/4